MIKIEINDKDKSKLIWLLNKGMEITKSDTKFNFYEQLLDKVLLSENKQGVSDSPTENGALPLVRESNASYKTYTITSESEHGTLEKITETKEVCNFFIASKKTSSATICENCGHEKFLHKLVGS